MKLWLLKRKLNKLYVKDAYWVDAINTFSSESGKAPMSWLREYADVVGRIGAISAEIKLIEGKKK